MRVSNLKPVFVIAILVVSFNCFIYVNTAPTADVSMSQTTLKVENVPVKETRMPDLKLVKSVVDLIGKFMTAK